MFNTDSLCQDLELSALVVTAGSNIKYISGYLADTAQLVFSGGSKYYLTDSRFLLEAKLRLTPDYIVVDTKRVNNFEVARALIGTAFKIGFDTDITHYEYLALEKAFNDCQIVDVTERLLSARARKNTAEIDNIITAQRIAEKSLNELKSTLTAGITEREVAARLEYLMKINGSSEPAFETIAAFGENSALPHAKAGERRLAYGDIILLDFGATCNNYRSDMTRTFVYGGCSEKIKDIYGIVLEANLAAIEAIKGGKNCLEVDAAARNIITNRGYGKEFIHSTGHGVGVDIHEKPYLSSNIKAVEKLSDGMVVTVEPGIYIEGLGGVRIEDMIAVVGGNAVNLTAVSKELEIIK